MPYRHLVAVAAVQQEFAIDQLPDDFRSRVALGVPPERESQQTVPGARPLAARTEAQQAGCLQSPGLRVVGDLGQRALRLEPLAVRAANRCVRPHHRGEVIVQGGRSNRPFHIGGVEEAEKSALVLRHPRGQAGQQVQRHRFEGERAVKHLLDLFEGGFPEQSMVPAFAGGPARVRRRQGCFTSS